MEFCKNIKQLSGESNWPIWKRKVRDLFEFYEGAIDVVENKVVKPQPLEGQSTEAQLREHKKQCEFYRKANCYAKSIITSTISDEIYQKVMDKESAFEMWEALKQQYEATSKDQLFKMCTELFSFQWNNKEDVSTHISKLKNLFNEINNGLRLKKENALPDLLLVCKILYVLPSSFEMFKSSWMMLTRDGDKTLDELIMQLCLFERNLNKSETDGENEEALMVNQRKEFNRKRNFKTHNKKEEICHYCKKKGHWLKECRKWISDGKPSKFQKEKVEHSNVVLQSLSEEVNYVTSKVDWWVDNGATKHVTHSSEFFIEYETFKEPRSIQAAGKETLNAVGKGTIEFLSKINNNKEIKIKLEEVWYVPGITRNLFSVLAAHDKSSSSEFKSFPQKCYFKVNNEVVLTGKREVGGSLYKTSIIPITTNEANMVLDKSSILQLYHERWGHQDKQHVMNKIQKEFGVKVKYNNEVCESCVYGKSCRLPFGRRETATTPGELISTDVCGPFPPSFKGYRYMVIYKDDYTKYRYGYIIRNKSDVKDTLLEMLANAKNQGHTIKTVLSDNGGEFISNDIKNIFKDNGINHKLTAPYTPQQNGKAERENRTIVEMARTFKYSNKNVKFPDSLWAEFVKSAIYILNRTGKSSVKDVSPFELWHGKKPRISHLRIIGSSCFIHIPSQKRKKLDKKAIKGFLVGYDGDERYRVYIKDKNSVELSRDVKFLESVTDCSKYMDKDKHKTKTKNKHNDKSITINIKENNEEELYDSESDCEDFEDFEDAQQDAEAQTENETLSEQTEDETLSMESSSEYAVQDAKPRSSKCLREGEEDSEDDEPITKRLRNRTVIINNINNDIVLTSMEYVNKIQTPSTYKEATESDQKENWRKAMIAEMNSLKENQTWELTELPYGYKALPGKWTYKIKTNPDGTIDNYKARLVIKGFNQKKGVDYDQTFSPVTRMSTIRSILSIAATEGLHLVQFDVSTAFLYGELEENIFMKQPEGFNDGTNRVCHLKRSLYGLKQAPRCWNKRIGNYIKQLGFKTSSADTCLYVREKNGNKIILALYVDDGLIAASNMNELNDVMKEMKKEFKIVNKDASYFLGLEIEKKEEYIKIHQKAYAKKILSKFNFSECRPVTTPMEKVSITNDKEKDKENIEFPYRQAVGALMYLMLGTRPDLAYSVGYLSRSLENPTKEDVQRVKRVFRYIAGTLDVGIVYNKKGSKSLECFSDADFGGCITTGRSTSGVVVAYAGGAISWLSQRQSMVSTSTTEAEIVAANEAAKELVWLLRLFKEVINFHQIPCIQIDNTAAIRLAQNPEFHKRTKHIAIKHFFIREMVTDGYLSVQQVSTEEQAADMLTKPLSKIRLKFLCNRLNIK